MSRTGILKRPGAVLSRSRRRTPSPVLGVAGKSKRFYDYKGRLAKGQALPIATIPQSFWEFGERYLFSGDYWGKQCQIIGVLDCLTEGRGGIHANLIPEGTDNQDMLKWAEGLIQTGYSPEIAVHLCPANCPKAPVSTGGLHGQFVSREDKGVAWYGNVASIPRESNQGELAKELANLSKGGDAVGGINPPGALAPTQANPSSSSSSSSSNRSSEGSIIPKTRVTHSRRPSDQAASKTSSRNSDEACCRRGGAPAALICSRSLLLGRGKGKLLHSFLTLPSAVSVGLVSQKFEATSAKPHALPSRIFNSSPPKRTELNG